MQENTKKEQPEKNDWKTIAGQPQVENDCSPDREQHVHDREIKDPVGMKTLTGNPKNILIFAHYTSSEFILGLVLEACARKV